MVGRIARAVVVFMIAVAAGAQMPAAARPVPEALRALAMMEHLPKKGDSGPVSWSTGAYAYDAAGNVAQIGTRTFVYDTQDRLKEYAPGGLLTTQTYGYDEYGNQNSNTIQGVIGVSTTTNHLTSNAASYDDAGNLTQWQPVNTTSPVHYTIDPFNLASEVTANGTVLRRNVYTADGERVRIETPSSSTTRWTLRGFDNKVLADVQRQGSTWSLARDYVYRSGKPLAAVTATRVENASLDHLGTLRFITDQGGQRIGYHEYYPFGVEAFPAGTLSEGSPVQFAGQERDPDPSGGTKGVDYIHARFYDPYVGRFLSTDPLGRRVPMHNPQAYNRFAYTLNNPLSGIDPDGQDNFFVFRPAAHETLPGAGDWGRVERAAAACGHTLTIYTDSNATVGAFNTARETSGSHVTYSGHTVTSATHVAGSVHLADGDVGAFNSDNSNPATPAGNTAASSLAVFGCNSSDLSSQYGSTTFTGVNSGNDGTTTLENLDLAAQAYVLGLIDTSSTAGATRDSDQQLSRSLDPRDAGDHVETFAPTTGPPSTDFDDRDDR